MKSVDRGLEHRLGVAPAAAPQVDVAVLGPAVAEHHAAAVALGELGDPVAPLRGAAVVEHRGAGGDEEAERPGAGHRVRGAALERRRGRLVEPPHALVDAGARDQRGALERQPEHLEVGHAEPAPELGGGAGELAGARGVAARVGDVALVEGEPAVLGRRLDALEQPLGALEPAVGDGPRRAEVELVDRQPQRHPRRPQRVAAVAVEREGALAGGEHRSDRRRATTPPSSAPPARRPSPRRERARKAAAASCQRACSSSIQPSVTLALSPVYAAWRAAK